MTPTYWVEMTLMVSGDRTMAERLVESLNRQHDGHVVYSFTPETRHLSLAMTVSCGDPIENVPPQVVGTVRSAAHELGFHTPGWPEPVSLGHVNMQVLAIDDVRVKALAA